MRQVAVAALIAALATFQVSAETPGELQGAVSKRVLPPQPGQKRLINVQINPEEQARFIAALPPFPKGTGGGPVGAQASPGAATAFPWFWDTVSPAMAAASSARLDDAVRALSQGPSGANVPTPRLQTLQTMAENYGTEILKATIGTRVSPALVLAVMGIESGGRRDAVSPKGATGLMQLMPATAARFGVTDIKMSSENIRGGVAYLDWLMKEFGSDPLLVLAGYNAGEGAVRQHGGVPPYRETRDYVPKVLSAWTVARGLCTTPPMLISDPCVFRVGAAGL